MTASSTIDEGIDRVQKDTRRTGRDFANGAAKARRTAASELSNLVSDLEDLLNRVANVADVDIDQLTQRLREKLESAKDTLADGGKRISDSARQAASATDGFVRESPWQSLGIAAVAGAMVGFLLARR